MFSEIPTDLEKLNKDERDKEIVRMGIIAELDAINLYEQLAAMTNDTDIKKIFLDVANEEKTHFGEFLTLLMKKDKDQVKELDKGKKEVEELI
ncbi:MAG TPA: rubrerythrin [Halobacteria archaeon]|nr:rubrerythrin [Halobacteria archaeon]